MRFIWDEQSIGWFLDAGLYTGFHKALAQKLLPHLAPDVALCDAGCGVGRLDLELAPHVRSLTAVDINESVICVLSRDASALGLHNLRTCCCNASSLTDSFDVVLLSFYGESNMNDFYKLCRRKLIRIVSAENRGNLYPERHRSRIKDTVPVVIEELSAKNISYELELCSLEFGQPLRTRREAELYVLKNAPQADAEEISGFLDERLEHTGREDFPLYLPNRKDFGIFIITVQDPL